MRPTSKRRWILGVLGVVVLHFALAPLTGWWVESTIESTRHQLAAKKSSRYLRTLGDAEAECRKELLPCVLAFRDYLEKHRIKLRVILRPERESLLAPDGSPQTETNRSALAAIAAEKLLKKEGIITVNLLPALHEETCRRKGGGVFGVEDPHFTKEMIQRMADTLAGSMKEHQLKQEGRHLLLVGDCYATLIAAQLKKGEVLPATRALWKNGGDIMMAYEISRLAPEALDEIREIYWVLNIDRLRPEAPEPLPLPSPPASRENGAGGERTLKAVLTKRTETPATLGKTSPYPNALILHEFTGENGEKILAVTEIMRAHEVNITVQNWFQKKPFILTLEPWDEAVRGNPTLAREQMLDDVQDFTAERYYIKDWSHAP